MRAHPGVTGRCPACGHSGSLFLAEGGYATCSIDKCPDPTAVADLLEKRIRYDRLRDHHTVILTERRWKLTHPITCDLATCKYDILAAAWEGPPRDLGTYRWDKLDQDPAQWEVVS